MKVSKMIVANLATFPLRKQKLAKVVEKILPQVDILNIVFNEYGEVPLEYKDKKSINSIIPAKDMKDTGKFLPDVNKSDYVLLIDDDIDYPSDYAEKMLKEFCKIPQGGFVAGLYGSIYKKPFPNLSINSLRRFIEFHLFPRKIVRYRTTFSFNHGVAKPILVDQLGTGTAILRGEDMPPYRFMSGSQKFVDVRFARWCFERNIRMVSLPRDAYWLTWEDDEHSIFRTFTVTHPLHVSNEVWSYAFKRSYVGKTLDRIDSEYGINLK